MAFLLAMYQKMRLTREKNQATFDLTKYSGKLTRVQKNIERQQKLFTSKLAKIDEQAKRMQSQAKSIFLNAAGLGTGNYSNVTNPYGFTGMNGFVVGVMQSMFAQGITEQKDSKGKVVVEARTLGTDLFQKMYSEYMSNGGNFKPQMENNQQKKDANGKLLWENFDDADVKAFNQALYTAQQQQTRAQGWASNMTTMYEQNVSIWVDAAKAEIEAQQDAVLEPLTYQETMWELEKTSAETKLERIKAELESYNNLCKEEIQNSAPKFGLG